MIVNTHLYKPLHVLMEWGLRICQRQGDTRDAAALPPLTQDKPSEANCFQDIRGRKASNQHYWIE